MPNVLAIGGLVASLLGSPVLGEPATTVPSEKIAISVETVNGSGCPAGTAEVTAAGNTAFTVSYRDYLAWVGVGAKATDARKNCQLNLRIRVPEGFTYAIAQVEHQGFAHLADGATGLQAAHYYFTGTSPTAHVSHEFRGPFTDSWRTVDRAEVLVYAPCGEQRNLNINTELRVDAGSSDVDRTVSLMAMDSTRAGVRTIYHLSWKECA